MPSEVPGSVSVRVRQGNGSLLRVENGGKCPWGGRKPGTRVKLTEEVERAIYDMARTGKSIAEIARVVKVSRPTVYATLKCA